MRGRYATRDRLHLLDPERDCQEIHRTFSTSEFPWDYGRGLEVALWRICAVPEISRVLERSGHFRRAPQRRYDDTRILLAELVRHGYDSPRGRLAIQRINAAHSRFSPRNEDMLYVLSCFVFEPVRWIDRWAWRRTNTTERLGTFHFFRTVGERLGVIGVPADYATFQQFNEDYERRRIRGAPSNRVVGRAVGDLYSSWYPMPVAALMRATLPCRLDRPARAAMGISEPSRLARAVNWSGLKAHAVAELVAPRTTARLLTRPAARSYPTTVHGPKGRSCSTE